MHSPGGLIQPLSSSTGSPLSLLTPQKFNLPSASIRSLLLKPTKFLTMLVVVGEKVGDKSLLKMIEDTKQRLERKTATPDTGKLDEKPP